MDRGQSKGSGLGVKTDTVITLQRIFEVSLYSVYGETVDPKDMNDIW